MGRRPRRIPARARPAPAPVSPSAAAANEWINVIFGAFGRAAQGLVIVAVLIFAGIELVNPELISATHHISPDLAQTFIGAALGALGVDLVGRKIRGNRR